MIINLHLIEMLNLFRRKEKHSEIEINDKVFLFYSPPSCSRIICKPI
jgi:hypothetical protein